MFECVCLFTMLTFERLFTECFLRVYCICTVRYMCIYCEHAVSVWCEVGMSNAQVYVYADSCMCVNCELYVSMVYVYSVNIGVMICEYVSSCV